LKSEKKRKRGIQLPTGAGLNPFPKRGVCIAKILLDLDFLMGGSVVGKRREAANNRRGIEKLGFIG
jgi:hypothetical protein